MKISKFLCGTLIAILLLELLVRLASPVIGPVQDVWQIQQQAKAIKLKERPASMGRVNLIVMGDSTAKEGIEPDALDAVVGGNFHTFNAALNSSTTYTIMKQANLVLETARPDYLLVLLGNDTSRESDDDPAVRTYNLADQATANTGIKGFFNRHLFLYKYRNSIRDPFILNSFYRSLRFRSLREGVVYRNVDTIKFNGDSIFPRSNQPLGTGSWTLPLNATITLTNQLPTATMRHLKLLLARCKALGVKLLLGSVPTTNYNAAYRNLIPSIAFALKVPYIQGNDATMKLADFVDGVHLNASGAVVFSELVGKRFKVLFPLP